MSQAPSANAARFTLLKKTLCINEVTSQAERDLPTHPPTFLPPSLSQRLRLFHFKMADHLTNKKVRHTGLFFQQ